MAESDLKEWLDTNGFPVPQPTNRDKLIASVRRNSRIAYLKLQEQAATASAQASKAIKGKPSPAAEVTLAEKAGWDAARDVNREIYNQGADEGASSPARSSPKANGRTRRAKN